MRNTGKSTIGIMEAMGIGTASVILRVRAFSKRNIIGAHAREREERTTTSP